MPLLERTSITRHFQIHFVKLKDHDLNTYTKDGDTLSHSRKRLCLNVYSVKRRANNGSATNKATVRGVTVSQSNRRQISYSKSTQPPPFCRRVRRHSSICRISFKPMYNLYGMKNDTELNSDAVAAFTRREMADNLRTRVHTRWI